MGIPSYFTYLIKTCPDIFTKYNTQPSMETSYFYMDCNSIIYNAYYEIKDTITNTSTKNIESQIIQSIIRQITEYIQIIRPTEFTYVAFDGIAPVAKMNQQRTRRYKSWYQNKMIDGIDSKWDTCSITPGTAFMEKMSKLITTHFKNNPSVMISGSNDIGEGEHKIFEHIRNSLSANKMKNTIIYGLDADLIMLSLAHLNIRPNIFLFRETPHFIQSINNYFDPACNYLMNISQLESSIADIMNRPISDIANLNIEYIFLCFLMGNDFLPHFPALNIRTGGINKVIDVYKRVYGKFNCPIVIQSTNGKYIINFPVLKNLIRELASNEQIYIQNECIDRIKWKNKYRFKNTPDGKKDEWLNSPILDGKIENYICPSNPHWQNRYYHSLFNNCDNISNICLNYLEGLSWTLTYYTTDCPNWRWTYNYMYPPLLEDLSHTINNMAELPIISFEPPVSKITQLCYVIPNSSHNLIPKKSYIKFIQEFGGELVSNKHPFIWTFCRYFWESHVYLPNIDINIMESKL